LTEGPNGDVNASKPTRLTNNSASDAQPGFSPKGNEIVFWRGGLASGTDGGQSGYQSDFDSELYVMEADGTNQHNITNTSTWGEITPDWSPAPIKEK
jgi:Tol biopolymer transport system component